MAWTGAGGFDTDAGPALAAPLLEARFVERYGIIRSRTNGSSLQGTSSSTLRPATAFGPGLPPTQMSTASITSPLTLTFLPSRPMSAAAWFPHPATHPDQCIVSDWPC